ncbi:MAG: LppX_LprAFG lipoprotein [Terracoccus sp.]
MRLTGRLTAAAISALCLLGASGCSGDDAKPAPTQQAAPSAAQRLAVAKTTLDSTPSVHLTLTGSDLPEGTNGIISADGVGTHPPAFKGTFKVRLGGIEADAEITSVDGDVYAKLPLIPGTNKIDPKTFGVPDPATLFSTDTGITSLLTATAEPTLGGQVRNGSDVLTTVTGTLPGASVVDLFGIGDRNGTFAATYGLTDADELRTVKLTGPFHGAGTTSTYSLVLDRYGDPVTIVKP